MAERICAVLLWTVSRDSGREGDLRTYRRALDLLWDSQADEKSDRAEAAELRGVIEGLEELSRGDESVGAAAYARQAAVGLHTGLGLIVAQNPSAAIQSSSVARNFAFRLGRRTGTDDLLTREDEAQAADVALLSGAGDGDEASAAADRLRRVSAGIGGDYLAVAMAEYGDEADEPRVGRDQGQDRDECRQDPDPEPVPVPVGTVGRLLAGEGAGRYVLVERLPGEAGESGGYLIQTALDPALEKNSVGEWVEDPRTVRSHFEERGWVVEWGTGG
ncbi:hypothetical protein [Streptomyces sp. NPDC051219]|uniref:hypothetical protein n=1 Tax=Streptomyces sp. NPDC051219 TaxID=3155283 RepID=UPI00342F1F2F